MDVYGLQDAAQSEVSLVAVCQLPHRMQGSSVKEIPILRPAVKAVQPVSVTMVMALPANMVSQTNMAVLQQQGLFLTFCQLLMYI